MLRLVPENFTHIEARERLLDRVLPARFTKTSERLREGRLPANGMAFSALEEGKLVGTVRLWNIALACGRPALLLGPLAVDCDTHGKGIGGALMRHAIHAAKARGHGAILLVGDAPYYSRFGFSADLTRQLVLPGPVERARFLGLELVPGALAGAQGLVTASGTLAGGKAPLRAPPVEDRSFRFAA